MINFYEGKRNDVKITTSSFNKLWKVIVVNEREEAFSYAENISFDENNEDLYNVTDDGEVETNKSIGALQKTLKFLHRKANIFIQQYGVNTLFLICARLM